MSGLFKFIANLFKMLTGNWFELRKIKKDARKEVKDEKGSGGMDSVRNNSSAWFRRNR